MVRQIYHQLNPTEKIVFLLINLEMEVTKSTRDWGGEERGKILIQTEVGLWKVRGLKKTHNPRLETAEVNMTSSKSYVVENYLKITRLLSYIFFWIHHILEFVITVLSVRSC